MGAVLADQRAPLHNNSGNNPDNKDGNNRGNKGGTARDRHRAFLLVSGCVACGELPDFPRLLPFCFWVLVVCGWWCAGSRSAWRCAALCWWWGASAGCRRGVGGCGCVGPFLCPWLCRCLLVAVVGVWVLVWWGRAVGGWLGFPRSCLPAGLLCLACCSARGFGAPCEFPAQLRGSNGF